MLLLGLLYSVYNSLVTPVPSLPTGRSTLVSIIAALPPSLSLYRTELKTPALHPSVAQTASHVFPRSLSRILFTRCVPSLDCCLDRVPLIQI